MKFRLKYEAWYTNLDGNIFFILLQWYRVDKTKIREDILKLWKPLGVGERKDQPDKSAEDFLARSANKSDSLLLQVWHSLATSALSWFITRTSING